MSRKFASRIAALMEEDYGAMPAPAAGVAPEEVEDKLDAKETPLDRLVELFDFLEGKGINIDEFIDMVYAKFDAQRKLPNEGGMDSMDQLDDEFEDDEFEDDEWDDDDDMEKVAEG